MDIYEDRTDWQMKDHVDYNTPLEWPENVFGEELGGGANSPADDSAPGTPARDDDDMEMEEDGDDKLEDDETTV